VLTKLDATNYNTAWQTPSTGLTLPLTQNLTFSPDNTQDIGTNATTARPRDLWLGRNATIGGTLGVTGNSSLSTLGTSGLATLSSLSVTNNAIVGGTLGVTGASTLGSVSVTSITGNGSLPTGGSTGQVLQKNSATNYDVSWVTPAGGVSFPLLAPNGAVGAPSYSFSSSGSTGMYAPATGQVALAAAGAQVLQATSTTLTVSVAASLSSTLGVTGASTLAGVTCTTLTASGLISANLGLTVSGANLLFSTDNTRDIGASGATRPRDLWLGRNASIGGTLGVTGASTLAGLTATTVTASGLITAQASISVTGGAITGSGSVPTGGTAGQVLTKNSATNYDVAWTTVGGGVTWPLLAPNGSVGAPSYSFSVSSGTGMYSPTTNQVALAAGGTQVLQATSTTLTLPLATLLSSTLGVTGATTLSSTLSVGGNQTFAADATYDIGGLATNRPRDVNLSRNLNLAGNVNMGGSPAQVGTTTNTDLQLQSNAISRWRVTNVGHSRPESDNTYDIGTSSQRVRDVYSASLPRPNMLTNGGMEIWQRGTGPFAGGGIYSADRWVNYVPAGTTSVSRDSANADGTGYCAAITTTAPSINGIYQVLDFGTDTLTLRNKTVYISVRVKCSQANSVRVGLFDDKATTVPSTWSSYHSGGGAYETLTSSITIGNAATGLTIWILGQVAGTWYVDNVMLVSAPGPVNYLPIHPADDLARCLRYYEILGPNATGSLEVAGVASAGGQLIVQTFRYVPKAITPTVTKVGTWNTTNTTGQPIVNGVDTDSFYLSVTSNAAGVVFAWNGTAGNKITVEANS
jgi:hypothetical protein